MLAGQEYAAKIINTKKLSARGRCWRCFGGRQGLQWGVCVLYTMVGTPSSHPIPTAVHTELLGGWEPKARTSRGWARVPGDSCGAQDPISLR